MRIKEQPVSVIHFAKVTTQLLILLLSSHKGSCGFSRGFFYNNQYVPIPSSNSSQPKFNDNIKILPPPSWSSVGLIHRFQSVETTSEKDTWKDATQEKLETDKINFSKPQDVVSFVQDLEQDGLKEDNKKDELLPEVLNFLEGALTTKTRPLANVETTHDRNVGYVMEPASRENFDKPTERTDLPLITASTTTEIDLFSDSEEDDIDDEDPNSKEIRVDTELDKVTVGTEMVNASIENDADDESLPEDLEGITEDIVDDIEAGVEESLRISDALNRGEFDSTENDFEEEERQFPIYLFQGNYVPESRLNKFIDGALRNMGTEVRIASMDPLYFRVLPRGHVEHGEQPITPLRANVKKKRKRRRPGRRRRKRPLRGKRQVKRNRRNRKKKNTTRITTRIKNLLTSRRRAQQQRKNRLKKRRRRRQQIRRRQRRRKQKQQEEQRRRRRKTKHRKQRIKRKARYVGGGRVDGLSKVERDGDAEMQLFGNYTLIRSHMKIGPVDLTMQFRTRRGLRRTSATLPIIKVHTVTRVNREGSEMIDFLLDRPHPETIAVRGNLFPLAERVARNIFARLFLPRSFLVQKLREKSGLALLSKPSPGRSFVPAIQLS